MPQNKVKSLISSITGHAVTELHGDMELESDIGLDSLKSFELFIKLQECVPEDLQSTFTQTLDQSVLMELSTIDDIVNFLTNWIKQHSPQDSEVVNVEVSSAANDDHKNQQALPVQQEAIDIELLNAQLVFLVANWSISTCSLCSRLRIEGQFNQDKLQTAWSMLLSRHPSLRANFKASNNNGVVADYQFHILPEDTPAPSISVYDLTNQPKEQQEQILLSAIADRTGHQWDINSDLLNDFSIYLLSEGCFEIFLSNHHLISDGLSNQKILEELVLIYDAELAGTPAQLTTKTTVEEYQHAVEMLNGWNDDAENHYLRSFLKAQGRQNFLWNPLRSTKNTGEIRHVNRKFKLGKSNTQKLIQAAGAARVSLNSVVASALLRTMKKFDSSLDEAIINVPTNGRIYPEMELFHMIGCFAQNLALTFPLPSNNESDQSLTKRVQKTIYNSLSNGVDRAQTRDIANMMKRLPLSNGCTTAATEAVIKSGMKSNVFLSFIGRTSFKDPSSLKLLDYHPATTTSANTIDTLVEIYDENLMLAVNADQAFFPESFVMEFGAEFISSLEQLELAETESTKHTISDAKPSLRLQSELLKIAASLLERPFSEQDYQSDLESHLGMDSLDRIRIVSSLKQHYNISDISPFMQARSLAEMASLIDGSKFDDEGLSDENMPAEYEMPYEIITKRCQQSAQEVAIHYKGVDLSYAQLQTQSNQLANYLRSVGVCANTLVAIMAPRTPEMLIATLAILKAGGAYVPLDPTYPSARLQYILEHSGAKQLISFANDTKVLGEILSESSSVEQIILMDEQFFATTRSLPEVIERKTWQQQSSNTPQIINKATDMMVVLYTSGSTGKPKGVCLNHQGYTNRLQWMQKTFSIKPGDRVAHKTSCCFDISLWEMFWPLMEGATICPVDHATVSNPWELASFIQQNKINIMHFVPSLFGEFLNIIEDDHYAFPELRWLVFSGEALPVSYISRWIDRYGMQIGLANLYGPTEASIDVTYHIIESAPDAGQLRIPIGKPVDNTQILILDNDLKRLPVGEEGELYIAGVQLAKGYFKDTEKTNQAFIPNPFPDVDSTHIYRTGDLAVELADGSFDYHGRIDNQVKIRGYRIELGEIEAVLADHDQVENCGVVVTETANCVKRIVACTSGANIPDAEFRRYCAEKLPHYMVPHRFAQFEKLPLNHNGKLDRKALLEMLNKLTAAPGDNAKLETQAKQLPVGPAQKWLLQYFNEPYRWSGTTRFTYCAALDTQVLGDALKVLIKRHCSLRTTFERVEEQWQQSIADTDLDGALELFDATEDSNDALELKIEDQVKSCCEKFDIGQLPLIKVNVYKLSDNRFEFVVIAHHLICDMLAARILFADLWSIYGTLVSGKNNVEYHKQADYSDYVAKLAVDSKRKQELVNYWCDTLSSCEHLSVRPEFAIGDNNEASAAYELFFLSEQDTTELMRKAKSEFNCSTYEAITAPLYITMSSISGQERVVISHRTHGRKPNGSNEFFTAVGNFATNYPVPINVSPWDSATDTMRKISETLAGVPLKGISYDLVSDHLPKQYYPDNKLTPVRVNYLGNRDVPKSNLFKINEDGYDLRYALPEQRRTCLIEFIFSITNKQLGLRLEYSSNFYSAEYIRRIGEQYMNTLGKTITSADSAKDYVEQDQDYILMSQAFSCS